MLNKYGAEYTMQIPSLKKKVENTSFKKYGYKNAFQNNNWQKEKGGTKNSWSEQARKHRKENYEKLGIKNTNWSKQTFDILKNKNSFTKYLDKLLAENDPELQRIWKNYLSADSMSEKLNALKPLSNR